MKTVLMMVETHGTTDLGDLEGIVRDAHDVRIRVLRAGDRSVVKGLFMAASVSSYTKALPMAKAVKRIAAADTGIKTTQEAIKNKGKDSRIVWEKVAGRNKARINIVATLAKLHTSLEDFLVKARAKKYKRSSIYYRLYAAYLRQSEYRRKEEVAHAARR